VSEFWHEPGVDAHRMIELTARYQQLAASDLGEVVEPPEVRDPAGRQAPATS